MEDSFPWTEAGGWFGDDSSALHFIFFLAVLVLHYCPGVCSVAASRGYALAAELGLLIAMASPCSGSSCCRAWVLRTRASGVSAHGLSSCSLRV